IPRLRQSGLTVEQALCVMIGAYLFIRYGLSRFLKKLSVHRGMFHSIPALFVAGLAVFDVYHHENVLIRLYLAGARTVGFLSRLILDAIFAVDLRGIPRLKHSFGTALKLSSRSWKATLFCYLLLFLMAGIAIRQDRDDGYGAGIRPVAHGSARNS